MKAIGFVIGTLVLLVVELVATMLVYTGLNLYSLDLFGQLVRFAGGLLEVMTSVVDSVFADNANSAYASVFGELGPKSILLLLVGLAVAAVLRSIVSLVAMARRD